MESMVSMRKTFWKNKRVLITGYEGFLGSNLTKRMLDYGAKVTGVDILTNRKHTILSKSDFKKIKVIKGSVETYKIMNEVLHKNKIEVVFHLAAKAIACALRARACSSVSWI